MAIVAGHLYLALRSRGVGPDLAQRAAAEVVASERPLRAIETDLRHITWLAAATLGRTAAVLGKLLI